MKAEEKQLKNSDVRLLHSFQLTNLLSFGKESNEIHFNALNLLIGPNGSGKSNLIEAIDLLRSTPKDLPKPIREGGGVREWIWKGADSVLLGVAINAVFYNPFRPFLLRHQVAFSENNQRFELTGESIEDVLGTSTEMLGDLNAKSYYVFSNGASDLALNEASPKIQGPLDPFNDDQSVLSQLRDPQQYPEITYLAQAMDKVRIYRDWQFGRNNPARLPQKADLPNYYLAEDASNLGLVLNRFKREPAVKKRVLEALSELYDGIEDYDVSIEGGTVQVFLQEGNATIPATRLSDGTLRYLCLLAILCHPKPPPLVCIEEPELGLHPDIMPALAQLLKEASTRSQLIVTTHSDELVDAMTDQPESVLVCEKGEEGTTLTRLNAETLKPWLEKYRLGELWTKGEIGGMRW